MNKIETKILLVEDDPNLGYVIRDNLKEAGYEVQLAKDGKSGYEEFLKQKFDLCILDIMLPKKDGFSLAEDIRKTDKEIPVIFLTAKSLPEDKIRGLKLGADDYITKPFHIEELILRMEAILKRSRKDSPYQTKKDVFTIGSYTFDYKNLELKNGKNIRSLTKKEAELLRLLCIHENELLERETALKIVWGEDDYFLGRSMDVFITKLRKYLSGDKRIQISNVRGVGFKMAVRND